MLHWLVEHLSSFHELHEVSWPVSPTHSVCAHWFLSLHLFVHLFALVFLDRCAQLKTSWKPLSSAVFYCSSPNYNFPKGDQYCYYYYKVICMNLNSSLGCFVDPASPSNSLCMLTLCEHIMLGQSVSVGHFLSLLVQTSAKQPCCHISDMSSWECRRWRCKARKSSHTF